LTKPHVKVGEHDFEPQVGVTFMAKLGVDEIEGIVVDSPELWSNTTGKVMVGNKSFTIEDYEGLYGHKVKVWYKGTNVLAVDVLSTEKKLTGTQYNSITDKAGLKFFVNYTVADFVYGKVYYNGVKDGHEFEVSEADEIVAVYEGSKPIAVKAVKYEFGTVTDVYPYRSAIYVDSERLELGKLDEVIYQGAVEKFADIKKGDFVHYIYDEDNGHAILIVVRDTYTGKLVEITYDGKLKIDDKLFTPISGLAVDDELFGKQVTVYLNKDGKVFDIEGLEPATIPYFHGIVQAVSTRIVENNPAYFAKFLTVDGEVEYRVKARPTVGSVVYNAREDNGEVTLGIIEPEVGRFTVVDDVYETNIRGEWTIKVGNTLYTFVEDKVLWAEKT